MGGVLAGSAGASPTLQASPTADSVQVRALGADSVTTRPGTTVTLRFRLTNASDTEQTVALSLDLPNRWRALTRADSVTLGPGERRLQLASVAVPAGIPSGPRRLRLRAQPGGAATVTAWVPVVQRARLQVQGMPRRSAAGRPYDATVVVANDGNAPVRYALSATADPPASVSLRDPADSLAPGAQKRVRLTIETESVERTREQEVTVRSRLTPWDTTLTARATVELVPFGVSSGILTGPSYPGTLRLSAFGSRTSQTGQVSFEGSSDLGTDGRQSLDLLLRAPNQSGRRFGRRSTYRATYTTPSWTVRAGDHTFSRTRLAEPGTFGLGGEVQYEKSGWRVGGYGLRRRFGNSVWQGAVYGGAQLHPRVQALANIVCNEGGVREGALGTLRATAVPWSRARLQVEGGYGRGRGEAGAAYRAELQGRLPRTRYQVTRSRTDADFPSTSNDARRTTGQLSIRPTEGISLSGSLRRATRDRVTQDQATSQSFTSTTAQAGAALRAEAGGINWSLQARGRLNRRPLQNEDVLSASAGLSGSGLSLSPTVEIGRIRPSAGGSARQFQGFGLDTSLRVGRQSLGTSVEWTQAPPGNEFTRRSRLRAAASLQLRLGDRTTLQTRARLRQLSESSPTRTSGEVQLRREFSFGHSLVAEARYRDRNRGGENLRAQLTYAIPVSVPTPNLSPPPVLEGRVVDAQTDAPIPGARVRLGPVQRLTDDQGQFSISFPGGESARLQVSGLALGRVPLLDLPRQVTPKDVTGGFVIPIADAASLTVETVLYGFPTTRAALRGDDPEPIGPLVRELVRIERDGETTRRLTGPDGKATADRLRPGPWTISLAGIQVPNDKAPEQDSLTVDLRPGQDTTVTIRVLPTQRPEIQFQEGEGLSLGPEEDPGADAEAERKGENEPEPTSADKAVPFAFSMGPYVAQVGAFSQLNRALRRAEQVRTVTDSVGITPYTTSTDTLYRVQAGPYPSASVASAALNEQASFSTTARHPWVRNATGKRFVVQVGALSSWNRARKRAAQAAEQGYSVSIQPEMRQRQVTYRVQAGRYRNRSAAEEARAVLGGQISGTARVLGTAGQGNYSVQVGAFTDLKQAQKQVRQLRGSDVPAYVHYKFPAPPYKVLVGRYTQRAPAERQENDLKSKFPGAFVLDLFAPSRD